MASEETDMLPVLAIVVFVIAVPITLYVAGRAGGQNVWGRFLQGYKTQGAGAYRAQTSPVWVSGKPPAIIHVASISSFIMGQMVVPGALAALVGLVVSFEILARGPRSGGDWVILLLMLSVPTGLMIGAKQLDVGLALLQRAETAVQRARALAKLSIIHNFILIVAMGLVGIFTLNDAVWFPLIYACVSIAQAWSVVAAASAIEAHSAAEETDRERAAEPPQWVTNEA